MRLGLKLSDEMSDKVSAYAKQFGVSKSAFMSFCIGSYIRMLESQDDILDNIKVDFKEKIKNA